MSKEDVEVLLKVRGKLVEQRRIRMRRDMSKSPGEISTDNLVALQAAIDAVDRAIVDEEGDMHGAPNPVTLPP